MGRVRTVMTGVEGTPYYSNLFFANVVSPETAGNARGAVAGFWGAVAPTMANSLLITVQGDVAVINEADGEIIGNYSSDDLIYGGTGGVDMLPPTTQGLLRTLTDVYEGGRRVRGRVFIPAQMEANSSIGRPTNALATGIAGFGQDLIDDAAAGDVPWVVWSKKNGTKSDISACSFWGDWAVLRSRRD